MTYRRLEDDYVIGFVVVQVLWVHADTLCPHAYSIDYFSQREIRF